MKTLTLGLIGSLIASCLVHQVSAATILSVRASDVFKDANQLQLIDALAMNDFARADRLLKDLQVNATAANGETALWWQANVGNLEAYLYLLEKGASPVFQVLNSYNTLELAAAQKDPRFLEAAIARGGNANMISQFERVTPIFVAVQHRNKANVKLLLESGACPNVADTMGTTPVLWALDMKAFDVAALLLRNGASPAFKNRQGHDLQESLREMDIQEGNPLYDSLVEVRELIAEKRAESDRNDPE